MTGICPNLMSNTGIRNDPEIVLNAVGKSLNCGYNYKLRYITKVFALRVVNFFPTPQKSILLEPPEKEFQTMEKLLYKDDYKNDHKNDHRNDHKNDEDCSHDFRSQYNTGVGH